MSIQTLAPSDLADEMLAGLRARLDAIRRLCRDHGGRAVLMRPVDEAATGTVWAVPAETILAIIDPPTPRPGNDTDLLTPPPTTLLLINQVLRLAGDAGATIDELLDAMTVLGYQGTRFDVWAAVCVAMEQGSVVCPGGLGRCYATRYEP
jgi:hypothetical protein